MRHLISGRLGCAAIFDSDAETGFADVHGRTAQDLDSGGAENVTDPHRGK